MLATQPFQVDIPESSIEHILGRVRDYPWHEMPDDGGWDYGTNLDYLKDFCAYWVEHFDWYSQQHRLNSFNHHIAKINRRDLHFIYEPGSGRSPKPLLISHGWPGSVAEFLGIIEPLAHPERFGGNADDGFDVIAPSLPGFGFSQRPARPIGPRSMAGIFDTLMTDVLGYEAYIAQGGDWGGAIVSWLGYEAKACKAIHMNILTMRHPDGPQGEEELAWASAFDKQQIMQDGYRTQQATRPQTLSYAMNDSPVGVAAWILEKFHDWSDLKNGDIESVYSKDELLTNIMIYLVTRTFNTASWIYYGRREEGGRILSPEGRRVEVPTAAAVFPKEMLPWPPRSYVERMYNITQWTDMPSGGHFAALEEPQRLVDDIRKFARSL